MQQLSADALPPGAGAVAVRLKAVREAKGLSQQGFADLLGVKRQQVIDVERLKAKASDELRAAAVQKALVNPLWLTTGTGAMFQAMAPSPEEVSQLAQLALLETKALDVPAELQRTAQDWLLAIKTRDSQRIRLLAEVKKFDPKLLEACVAAVDGELEKRGLSIESVQRARLYSAVFQMSLQTGKLNEAAVAPMVNLAAG